MDETRVRGLLELAAAATEEPPSRVDVELARSRARRKLRWRRASLAGASAAAVVAVVVAAVAVPGSHGAAPGRGRAPEAHAQIIAPRQFSLVSPYAAFGWLPPGDSLDGGTLSPSNVYLTAGPGTVLGADGLHGRLLQPDQRAGAPPARPEPAAPAELRQTPPAARCTR